MAGVVLETLSNRKLFAFGGVLLLLQIAFFLIGGLIGESSMSGYRTLVPGLFAPGLFAPRSESSNRTSASLFPGTLAPGNECSRIHVCFEINFSDRKEGLCVLYNL